MLLVSKEVKTGANLGKRLERYSCHYKVVLDLKNTTGVGVNEAKRPVGLTLTKKLEKICPHFHQYIFCSGRGLM